MPYSISDDCDSRLRGKIHLAIPVCTVQPRSLERLKTRDFWPFPGAGETAHQCQAFIDHVKEDLLEQATCVNENVGVVLEDLAV